MDEHRIFKELTAVRLTRVVEGDGFVMPCGTAGVVMAAYADGHGYEVEFQTPRHVVLTLEADDICPAKEPARAVSADRQRP